MAGRRGYYSLIQYCPDPSRAEVANLGVLLFCPEQQFIDAKMSRSNQRISKIFGRSSFQSESINSAKAAFAARLKYDRERFQTYEDLQQFVATRANEVMLSAPRPMKVLDAEADLNRLFEELVGGATRQERRPAQPKFPEVDRIFRQPRFKLRMEFEVPTQIPIIGKTMIVPYVFQNGCANLFKPHRFGDDDRANKDAAMVLAVEGQLLHKYPEEGRDRKLIVISIADEKKNSLVTSAAELFKQYQVDLVTRADLPALLKKLDEHPAKVS